MLVDFFTHGKYFFPTIFDFHFRENPHFCDEFQALELKISSLLLSHNRTGVGTLIFFQKEV